MSITVPVRRFTWRADQRHRPGLKYMQATGRMHGFESLAERRLLLAVDFTTAADEVLGHRRNSLISGYARLDDVAWEPARIHMPTPLIGCISLPRAQ